MVLTFASSIRSRCWPGALIISGMLAIWGRLASSASRYESAWAEAHAVVGCHHDQRALITVARAQPGHRLAKEAVGVRQLEKVALECLAGERASDRCPRTRRARLA